MLAEIDMLKPFKMKSSGYVCRIVQCNDICWLDRDGKVKWRRQLSIEIMGDPEHGYLVPILGEVTLEKPPRLQVPASLQSLPNLLPPAHLYPFCKMPEVRECASSGQERGSETGPESPQSQSQTEDSRSPPHSPDDPPVS